MNHTSLMEELCAKLKATITDSIYGKVLDLFLSLVKEPTETLDSKVDKLISKHFKTASKYLRDAPHASVSHQKQLLIDASREFTAASSVEIPNLVAQSMFYVGICYDLLAERTLATRWYADAFEAGLKFEQLCIAAAQRKRGRSAEVADAGRQITSGAVVLTAFAVAAGGPFTGLFAIGAGIATLAAGLGTAVAVDKKIEKLIGKLGEQPVRDFHHAFLYPLAGLLINRGYQGELQEAIQARVKLDIEAVLTNPYSATVRPGHLHHRPHMHHLPHHPSHYNKPTNPGPPPLGR